MENVAIFDSPGKGRGLKATKEFWAGDVIFSEPSLAAVVFDRYVQDGSHLPEESQAADLLVVPYHLLPFENDATVLLFLLYVSQPCTEVITGVCL